MAFAFDGNVYVSMASDSTARAYPEGGELAYLAGIEVGQSVKVINVRAYTRVETLIDRHVGGGMFHPSSVKYSVGLIKEFGAAYARIEHMCWHPIDRDGYRDGAVEQYNLLTIGVKFGTGTE